MFFYAFQPFHGRIRRLVIAILIYLTLPFSGLAYSSEAVSIVATLPVLKDLAEAVGGRHVSVASLITGFESEHTYTPKPSDIRSIQEADLLIEVGLGLEVWIAPLIENADRPDLAVITTSKGIPLIDDDTNHSGHHGTANPHIWLDPENVKIMIAQIEAGLILIDPGHQVDYQKNAANYIKALSLLEKELTAQTARLQEKAFIAHHPAWPYFARRFGFIIKGTILKQVGSEPSAKQVAKLIKQIREEKIRVIVSEPQLNQKIPTLLAEETGATLIRLSPLPGALAGTERYLDLIRHNVEALIAALDEGT